MKQVPFTITAGKAPARRRSAPRPSRTRTRPTTGLQSTPSSRSRSPLRETTGTGCEARAGDGHRNDHVRGLAGQERERVMVFLLSSRVCDRGVSRARRFDPVDGSCRRPAGRCRRADLCQRCAGRLRRRARRAACDADRPHRTEQPAAGRRAGGRPAARDRGATLPVLPRLEVLRPVPHLLLQSRQVRQQRERGVGDRRRVQVHVRLRGGLLPDGCGAVHVAEALRARATRTERCC